MQLSVIILNYNVRFFLELCIKSVQEATKHLDAEIIVVDNNSPDDSCSMLRTTFPNIKVLENKENVGFSKANNQGVALAKGEHVCILNPDTVVAEDTFDRLLNFSKHTKNMGIVGCKLIDGTGAFLPESKRNIPTPRVSMQKILGNDALYYASLAADAIGKVAILVGAFMFMKREVYNNVGGFDEDYFMYGEDIDISYKVLKKGYDNYYYGKTVALHFKGESTLKDHTYAKRFYHAMHIFYKKHFNKTIAFDLLIGGVIRLLPIVSQLFSKQEKSINTKPILVLDRREMTYRDIIKTMQKQKFRYRLHSENSNFTVGSDSSKSRGEIMLLSDNLLEE
jgi:GT2 family glycosyltransferase